MVDGMIGGIMDDETPAWGTLEHPPVPDLLTTGTLIVTERSGFMSGRCYDLTMQDGEPLAMLTEETTAKNWFFGSAASSRFELTDPHGRLVAIMERPGSWGSTEFVVADETGREVGLVEEKNRWFTTELVFSPVQGRRMRMIGAGFGSGGWRLVEDSDQRVELGRVTKELPGLGGILSGSQRFAVLLSPDLLGPRRLLALMAAACMDYVCDQSRRNSASSNPSIGGSAM